MMRNGVSCALGVPWPRRAGALAILYKRLSSQGSQQSQSLSSGSPEGLASEAPPLPPTPR